MKYDIVLGIRAINVLHNIEPVSAIASDIKITLVASPDKYKKHDKVKIYPSESPLFGMYESFNKCEKRLRSVPIRCFFISAIHIWPQTMYPKIEYHGMRPLRFFAANSRGLQHFM